MELKKKAEYIYYAINNLSFWKSYFKDVKKNKVSKKDEDCVVYYNKDENYISVMKDYLLEYNDKTNTWSVQAWVSHYSYDNGYADSDYALVGTFQNIDEAIKTLLQIPVIDELNNVSENYYYKNNTI